MQRFFYDLTDGSSEPDLTGTEMPDRKVAVREAIRFLGDVLKNEPDRLADGTLRVNLHDEAHAGVCTIAVTIE